VCGGKGGGGGGGGWKMGFSVCRLSSSSLLQHLSAGLESSQDEQLYG
jgi:hypothetical protein